MSAIHLVERLNNVRRVPDAPGEWESGYWGVAEESAQRLVGGEIYLHSGQAEPSHFGGNILSYRVHRGGAEDGRIVFRFRATAAHRGVQAGREGWGNEKKFEW
jgi:hypothetical protein